MQHISLVHVKRFLSYVLISKSKDACWNWQASTNEDGYGKLKLFRKTVKTHHLAWWIDKREEIPKGLELAHTCDNPRCCNPDHLFLATHAQNMEDMAKKGRRRGKMMGEDNPRSKLTWEMVTDMRRLSAKGWKRKRLAEKYAVSLVTVDRVVNGISWVRPTGE